MVSKRLVAVVMLFLAVISDTKCDRYQNDESLVSKEQARLFGGFIGQIVSGIDWLPYEINVIDAIISAVKFFSGLLSSTSSTISSMSDMSE